MKKIRLILTILLAVSLISSNLLASEATLLDELKAAGIPNDELNQFLAGFWAHYLFQSTSGSVATRNLFKSVGLINVVTTPLNVTLTQYGKETMRNMLMVLRDEFISIGVGTLGAGVAESKAQYLFTDDNMRARWLAAGLITVVPYDTSDPDHRPKSISLTSYGRIVARKMYDLTNALIALGIPGGGVAESMAENLFLDAQLNLDWKNAGFISVEYDITGKITNITLTEYGTAVVKQMYDLSATLRALADRKSVV